MFSMIICRIQYITINPCLASTVLNMWRDELLDPEKQAKLRIVLFGLTLDVASSLRIKKYQCEMTMVSSNPTVTKELIVPKTKLI